jgi:gliding motility-associated-like protein
VTGQQISFDLGPDKTVCNQTSVTLSTGVTASQVSFLWSTGETTPSINVAQSGKYSVSVSGDCGTSSDNISVQFEASPPSISLGIDQVLCEFNPVLLTPIANPSDYKFLWQDNSTASSFQVTDFGKYWVTVKNDCGSVSDTITFTKYIGQVGFVPNVITPNGDDLNEYFKIDDSLKGNVSLFVMNRWGKVVYQSSSYMNDWSGSDLSPGVYYVVIKGSCIEDTKDWLTILH